MPHRIQLPPINASAVEVSPYITRKQAAQVACCDIQTIDKAVKAGRLRAYKGLGRRVQIRRSDLLALIEGTTWRPSPDPNTNSKK